MAETARQPKQFVVLNDFNAVCCLLVILHHTFSALVSSADPASPAGIALFFPWILAHIAVPGFIFVSGFKLGLAHVRRTEAPYLTYIGRRLKKLYLPYLAWNLIYYLCFMPIGYVQGTAPDLLRYLWFGNLSAQFYFVPAILHFYLLRPLWNYLADRVSWRLAVPGSFLVMLLSIAGLDRLSLRFPGIGPYRGMMVVSFLFYWVLGLCAGHHYEKLAGFRFSSAARLAAAGIVLLHLALSFRQFYTGTDIALLRLVVKPLFNAAAIFFVLSLCQRTASSFRRLKDRVYAASLSVFFSHCLFLTLGAVLLQRLGITRLLPLLAGRAAAAYVCPFVLYFAWAALRRRAKQLHRI